MLTKTLTTAALILSTMTLGLSAQSLGGSNQEPGTNPAAGGLSLEMSGAAQKAAGLFVAEVGDRITLDACTPAGQMLVSATASSGAQKNLIDQAMPFGGCASWSARIPPALAGQAIEIKAVTRTATGQRHEANLTLVVRSEKATVSSAAKADPKAGPQNPPRRQGPASPEPGLAGSVR